MNSQRSSAGSSAVLLSAIALTALLTGCEHSGQTAPQRTQVNTQKVFIDFEGPWAFVPDGKDPNMIVAIAPKAKGHRDLFVKASNAEILATGTYRLAAPSRGTPGAGVADPAIARAKNDRSALDNAIRASGQRYAIRLPKPDAYVPAGRYRSRVGPTYPPDASTEMDYATEVSVVYTVDSLNGFSLSGTADSGVAFDPLLLRLETPLIRFVIEPFEADDPRDHCNLHSRESFRNLTKLLNLTLYVDFPGDPPECRREDPQNPDRRKADGAPGTIDKYLAAAWDEISTLPTGDAGVSEANVAAGFDGVGDLLRISSRVRADEIKPPGMAMLLFAHPVFDCKAPALLLE